MAPYLKAAQYEPKSPNEHVEGVSTMLPLEGRSGYVFVLAYLSKKNPDNDLLLQLLNDHVHRLANSFGKDANAQHRFEQFLGSLNETLSQTVRDGRFSIPIHQFHAVVGIICEDRMFLSGTGELSALFLHRKPSQRYQVFNLFRGIQTEQALPTWEKPFAVVLDGDLEDGDAFCVSQKDLQRQIAQDELNSILTALPPTSATEKIRQYFPANDGLLLIILKVEAAYSSVPESYAKPLSDVSIDSFVRGQDETTKLLEDQKPNILRYVKTQLNHFAKKYTDQSRILQDLHRGEPRIKIFLNLVRSLSHNLIKAAKRTSKGIAFTFAALGNQEKRQQLFQSGPHIQERMKNTGMHLVEKTRALPVRTRRAIQLLILLILALLIGLTLLSYFHEKSAAQKALNQRISEIQNIIDKAGGAIIYKDENQARSLYQQAATLIQQLPSEKQTDKDIVAKLTQEINTAANELRHIITIANPSLTAHLDLNGEQKGIKMIKTDKELFVFDQTQHLWKIDLSTKQSMLVLPDPVSRSLIRDASIENGHIYVLNADNQILDVDAATGNTTQLNISSSSPSVSVSLLAYANRLYVLNQLKNNTDAEILKFTKSGSEYSSATSWITSKTETLAHTQSFTIDGALYVLHENGAVSRFQNGAELGWQIGIVDPPITTATRLWTDAKSKFLYILEPNTKRLLVYKKDTGAFLIQYTSDTFTDLADFSIDEKAQIIYLLSGSNIYSITAGHLKN